MPKKCTKVTGNIPTTALLNPMAPQSQAPVRKRTTTNESSRLEVAAALKRPLLASNPNIGPTLTVSKPKAPLSQAPVRRQAAALKPSLVPDVNIDPQLLAISKPLAIPNRPVYFNQNANSLLTNIEGKQTSQGLSSRVYAMPMPKRNYQSRGCPTTATLSQTRMKIVITGRIVMTQFLTRISKNIQYCLQRYLLHHL